jgi:hypothetical protein
MKKHCQTKRAYASPTAIPTEVTFEQSLLVGSVQDALGIVNMGIDEDYYYFDPESGDYTIDWE